MLATTIYAFSYSLVFKNRFGEKQNYLIIRQFSREIKQQAGQRVYIFTHEPWLVQDERVWNYPMH